MSKKMKGFTMESSIYGSLMYKHQSLIQDYQKLEKESEIAKNKVETMKQKKLTLLAEVRFLRQRHKLLLEMKSANPLEQKRFQHPILQTRHQSSTKEKKGSKKEMKLQAKTPPWNLNMKKMGSSSKKSSIEAKQSHLNQKEKKINGKEAFPENTNLGFNSNPQQRKYIAKEVTFKHPSEVLHVEQKERLYVGKESNSQKNLGFDLNQMERSYAVREEAVLNKAPVFDLNLKLDEEEDLQENYVTSGSEKPNNTFISGNEEQLNDLKLSICRNVENVPSRSGKRKISWQDPVALKV